jgi:hypothetical protein
LTNKVLVRLFVSMRLKYLVNQYLISKEAQSLTGLGLFTLEFDHERAA